MGIVLAILFFFLPHIKVAGQSEKVTIHWKESQAVAVSFPQAPNELLADELGVTLHDREVAILGKFERGNDIVSFHPIVPFTYEMNY